MIFHGKFRTKQGGLSTDSLNLLKRSTVNWNVASDRQLVSVTHTPHCLKHVLFFSPKWPISCNVSMFHVAEYGKQQKHPHPRGTLNYLITAISIPSFWKTLSSIQANTALRDTFLLYTTSLNASLAVGFVTTPVSPKAAGAVRQTSNTLQLNHSPL